MSKRVGLNHWPSGVNGSREAQFIGNTGVFSHVLVPVDWPMVRMPRDPRRKRHDHTARTRRRACKPLSGIVVAAPKA
jgi:hypothetical protein